MHLCGNSHPVIVCFMFPNPITEQEFMAHQLIREWTGIQQFPLATQTKLIELLGKLKQEVFFLPK